MDHLRIMIWPALLLAAGGPPNDLHDQVMCFGVNIVSFGLLGLFMGLIARQIKVIVAVYLLVCVLTGFIEAWGSGFNFFYFSWTAVILALVLYLMPFGAVMWSFQRFRHDTESKFDG